MVDLETLRRAAARYGAIGVYGWPSDLYAHRDAEPGQAVFGFAIGMDAPVAFEVDRGDRRFQSWLTELLEAPGVVKIVHDLKAMARLVGARSAANVLDTRLAAHLLTHTRTGQSPYSLHAIAQRELGHDLPLQSLGWQPKSPGVGAAAVAAAALLELSQRLGPQLEGAGLMDWHDTTEVPCSLLLADAEREGIVVDVEALRALDAVLVSELARLGPASPSGRRVAQLRTQWVLSILDRFADATGRVRSTYDPCGSEVGRITCREPNLQSVPAAEDRLFGAVQDAFVAHPARTFVAVDFAHLQLRLLAHLAEDPGLLEALAPGLDFHRAIAARIRRKGVDEVAPDDRRLAKEFVYTLLFGGGDGNLAGRAELPIEVIKQFRFAFEKEFPRVRAYLDDLRTRALGGQPLRSLLGRALEAGPVHSDDRNIRRKAERALPVIPLQGGQAEVVKAGLARVAPVLDDLDGRLVTCIFDELVFEVPDAVANEAATTIKATMEAALPLRAPLLVHVGMGKTLGEARRTRASPSE